MQRCEEIFRQICWLEERFWPDVDGMGEGDDSSRLGPNLSSMNTGMENGMNNGLNGSMQMNAPQMNAPRMNAPQMNAPPMNGLPNALPNGSMNQMNGQMSSQMNSQMNNGENPPAGDNRNNFGMPNGNGMNAVGQNS